MKLLVALALSVAAFGASAQTTCTGTGAYRTCYDAQSGNNYNIQKYGNTTTMQGSNGGTGSNWSQTSQTYGNTTYSNGTAADGSSWNTTTQSFGNGMRSITGSDSHGNTVVKTCDRYGNCY